MIESVDPSTPMGRMVFTVPGAVAELERNLIVKRVTACLTRAKKEGKQLGRPKIIVDREKVRKLHQDDQSIRTIANELGLTPSLSPDERIWRVRRLYTVRRQKSRDGHSGQIKRMVRKPLRQLCPE